MFNNYTQENSGRITNLNQYNVAPFFIQNFNGGSAFLSLLLDNFASLVESIYLTSFQLRKSIFFLLNIDLFYVLKVMNLKPVS